MGTKQFKAESKRLLDLMINSIYTNKEIFLREIISNASDAIDKLYYKSLTDNTVNVNRADLKIKIDIDKENKTISIKDNGCGMSEEELEKNLGTIAHSGSLLFKNEADKKEDINVIGQFGVGFYSAFMVSDKVTVKSRSLSDSVGHEWTSDGIEGYEIKETEKNDVGTEIILHLKEDTDEEKYSSFLDEYKIKALIKKYSDYIRYPIEMEMEHSHKKEGTENEYEKVKEIEVLNSMIPIWKKKGKVSDEEYDNFYIEKFYDFQKPQKVIHTSVEGQCSYDALLYIPSHLPYDFYTKEYEKGLQLYSNGVLIMEKCKELLPDYFGFVKGLVDSQDLSLNISREMLQHDRQLKIIAKNIENKIRSELEKMLNNDRPEYEKFFTTFGLQLKFGAYNDYGANKDKLKDLLMFYSSAEKKLVTFKEYVSRTKEGQNSIYYAAADSIEKAEKLPQVEQIKDKGYEILYLTENVDEFALQIISEYDGKKFVNVCGDNVDLDTDEEKNKLKEENEQAKDMLNLMKEALSSEVEEVRFTNKLKNHPVCLTSEGQVSIEMEKTINSQMGGKDSIKAKTILEINQSHKIAQKLKDLFNTDREELKKYAKVLYSQARLIEGLQVEDPTEISNIICDLISK